MNPLTVLWLPILVSTVLVFFASFIMHMVLTYHRSDYRKLSDEDPVTDALRNANATPGPNYFFPFCSFEEMKSPAMIEKMKRGPVGFITLLPPGPPAMGRNLVQWFIYCLVISTFAAYLSGNVLAPGSAFLQVVRVVGISRIVRLRSRSRSGIDLGWPKLGGDIQTSFRQRDFRRPNCGNIRLVVA